jgi:hypothetical protein
MNEYNRSDSICFDGEGIVLLANNTYIKVNELKKGDRLFNLNNMQCKVVCVIKQNINAEIDVCSVNEMLISPYHPIYLFNKWMFPSTEFKIQKRFITSLYNIVLDNYDSIVVNFIPVITLGHNLNANPITKHDYFGTNKIRDDLKLVKGYDEGLIECKIIELIRCTETHNAIKINVIFEDNTSFIPNNFTDNTSNIVDNTSNIVDNTSNIVDNTSNLSVNTSNIIDNTSNIVDNSSNLSVNNTSNIVVDNTSNIIDNTSNIVVDNSSNISVNTSNIVVDNSSNLSVNNTSNIVVDNSSNIVVDNSSNIVVDNSSNLSVNTSNIVVDNSSNLSVNTSNIVVDNSSNLSVDNSSNIVVDNSSNLAGNN